MEFDSWIRAASLALASSLTACSSSDESHQPALVEPESADTTPSAPDTADTPGNGGAPAVPEVASGGTSGMGGFAGTGGMLGSAGMGGFAGIGGMPGGGSAGLGGSNTGGMPSAGAAGMGGFAGLMATAGSDPLGVAGMAGGGGTGGGDVDGQFTIRFDYRFDTAGFFDAPERRAALEAAGAVWSRLIEDDFGTVPAGTSVRLRNPENRDEYVWVDIEEDIDDLLVFVGSSDAIPGLGRGGSAGVAESTDADVQAALSARVSGADFEPWAGSISFNPTSDVYFDTTPETADDIPFEQFDFITNAAHELGHVLGFLSGNVAFDALVEEQTFVGANAAALYGGPVPLAEDLGHFPQGELFDGVEPLMDTSQTNGLRTVPTPLDLAVLSDVGYEFAL